MNGDPQVEALSRAECMDYLASAKLGRLGLTMRALPEIVPVRYVLTEDHAVFRAPFSSRIWHAANGSIVTLQADHHGEDTGVAWTVQVRGLCQEILDPNEMNQLFDLALPPWRTSPPGDSFMRIPLTDVRGERVIW